MMGYHAEPCREYVVEFHATPDNAVRVLEAATVAGADAYLHKDSARTDKWELRANQMGIVWFGDDQRGEEWHAAVDLLMAAVRGVVRP